MQLKELEYLLKTVECGSITKAAEQMFISQPTLTKNIQSLENEYNIKIFQRVASGVELTEQGKDFVYYAREVVAAAESLNNNFFGGNAKPSARLYVASQCFDFTHDIFLKTYKQNEGKNISGSLTETDRDNVVSMVIQNAADLGLFIRTNSDGKSFLWKTQANLIDIHHIATDQIFICVGPDSPLYDKKEVTIEDAKKYSSFALDMKNAYKQNTYVDSGLKRKKQQKVFFFNSIDACKHFLLNTDMVLYINKWTAGCFDNSQVHVIPIVDNNSNPYNNELVWCKRVGEPLSAVDRQFLTNLYNHFGIICRDF